MKVIFALVLTVASVSAIGSGPYLPSGWKPDGPAFFLPSEIQTRPAQPVDVPEKVVIFQETEASGSEGLREYGPPKLDAVINQGLPDAVAGQLFTAQVETKSEAVIEEAVENVSELKEAIENVVEESTAKIDDVVEQKQVVANDVVVEEQTETSVAQEENVQEEVVGTSDVIAEEEKETTVQDDNVEQQVVIGNEEVVAVTEQVVAEEKTEVNEEDKVVAELRNAFEVVAEEKAVEGEVAVTDSAVVQNEDIVEEQTESLEPIVVEEVQTVEEVAKAEEQTVVEETETSTDKIEQEVSEITTDTAINADTVINANTAINGDTAAELSVTNVESVQSEVEQTVQDIVEAQVVEAVETAAVVANQVNIEQEVKTVEQSVNNIAEALVNLEKEIKSEQVQTELKSVAEAFNNAQVPEGFLEYGPPGFREYGPPKGDELLRTVAQESLSLQPLLSNELRRRRFSPKFKSNKKH